MDAEEIEAIRKRCEAATEGPWEILVGGNFIRVGGPGYRQWTEGHHLGGKLLVGDIRTSKDDNSCDLDQSEANGNFIAHARTDVPLLLSALDAARKETEELRSSLNERIIGDRFLQNEITALQQMNVTFDSKYHAAGLEVIALREKNAALESEIERLRQALSNTKDLLWDDLDERALICIDNALAEKEIQ